MHGHGVLAWPDGFVISGNFEQGLRHGNALELLNDDWVTVRADSIYERDRLVSRQPVDTVKNGTAVLDTEGRRAGRLVGGRSLSFEEAKRTRNRGIKARMADGGVYAGQVRYLDGVARLDGRGHVTYWQGSNDSTDAMRSYHGTFCNDKRHGIGQGRWDMPPYETVYAGAWEEGHPSGPGIMTWHDGTEYKGEFSRGRPHGFGIVCIPGKFDFDTGEASPSSEQVGVFHHGRLYISADMATAPYQNGPTSTPIHLAIPPPRPGKWWEGSPSQKHSSHPSRNTTKPNTAIPDARGLPDPEDSANSEGATERTSAETFIEMGNLQENNLAELTKGVSISAINNALRSPAEEEIPRWKVQGFPHAKVYLNILGSKLARSNGVPGQTDPYLVFKRGAIRNFLHASICVQTNWLFSIQASIAQQYQVRISRTLFIVIKTNTFTVIQIICKIISDEQRARRS